MLMGANQPKKKRKTLEQHTFFLTKKNGKEAGERSFTRIVFVRPKPIVSIPVSDRVHRDSKVDRGASIGPIGEGVDPTRFCAPIV